MDTNSQTPINAQVHETQPKDGYASICNSSKELIETGNNFMQNAEGALNAFNDCSQSVQHLIESVSSGMIAWKEIDKEMLAMDLHFRSFEKTMDKNLEKYKSRLPIIEKQLDAVSTNLGKILDAVLVMDAQTEAQINMKMKMMDRIDQFLNTISNTMIKLL